jgi:hypothetical protein
MTKLRLVAAFAGVLCLIVSGALLYTYESDKTAWDEVQSKLIRLDSGLEYESILQLRSKLADADAASKEYTVQKHIFPLHNSQRIADSEQAISYLDVALTLHSSSGSSVANELMAALEEHGAATTLIPRVCTNGYLKIDRLMAESVFLSEGLAYLHRAQSDEWKPIPALGPYPLLEFVNEEEQCQQKDQKDRRQVEDEREAAIRNRWSAWRYHIQIKASESCTFRIASDGDDGGFSIVHEGADKEFGVNTSLTLSRFICAGSTAPKVAIQVYVNEKPVKLDWHVDAINVITPPN